MDDEALVAAYWDAHRRSVERVEWDEAHHDAFSEVNERMRARNLDSVALVVSLAAAVRGDVAALAYLGAGPVEDLLHGRGHPPQDVVDAIDEAARRDEDVRTALRCVWWDEHDDAGVVARLSRFGPPL